MQTAHEKYVDHPLFKECIEISCPQGWMRFLDEAVAEIEKINVMLILGEKEEKYKLVSIRRRFEGNTGTIGFDELKLDLVNEIKNRSLSHRKETATTS